MHSLARPEVLRTAILAGLCSALVCWPRIATAPYQRYPICYLEAVVLSGSIVLWGFVLAWHTQYTQRPVFTLKVAAWPFALATSVGLATARSAAVHLFLGTGAATGRRDTPRRQAHRCRTQTEGRGEWVLAGFASWTGAWQWLRAGCPS
jgi:hypothetical protein